MLIVPCAVINSCAKWKCYESDLVAFWTHFILTLLRCKWLSKVRAMKNLALSCPDLVWASCFPYRLLFLLDAKPAGKQPWLWWIWKSCRPGWSQHTEVIVDHGISHQPLSLSHKCWVRAVTGEYPQGRGAAAHQGPLGHVRRNEQCKFNMI